MRTGIVIGIVLCMAFLAGCDTPEKIEAANKAVSEECRKVLSDGYLGMDFSRVTSKLGCLDVEVRLACEMGYVAGRYRSLNRDLDDEAEEVPLKSMPPDSEGWIVPWALCINAQGDYSLMPEYPVHVNKGGTVDTRVMKGGDNRYYFRIMPFTDTDSIRRSETCEWGDELPAMRVQ